MAPRLVCHKLWCWSWSFWKNILFPQSTSFLSVKQVSQQLGGRDRTFPRGNPDGKSCLKIHRNALIFRRIADFLTGIRIPAGIDQFLGFPWFFNTYFPIRKVPVDLCLEVLAVIAGKYPTAWLKADRQFYYSSWVIAEKSSYMSSSNQIDPRVPWILLFTIERKFVQQNFE